MRIDTVVCGDYQTNCYIARREESREAIIVDPGDDVQKIKSAVEALGVKPAAVLLTHGHFDHTIAAHAMKEAYGIPVYIGREDEPCLSDSAINAMPEVTKTPFVPMKADGYLEEGAFSVAGIDFTVIPTPGHTMGGVCLLAKDEGVLFTGDTLFQRGFGRTDLYGGNWGRLLGSLRRLFRLDGDPMVYPGHGEGGYLTEIRKGYYQ